MWGRFTNSGLQLESVLQEPLHRRMKDMGFSCRIPCVKPLLNNRQHQKRLAWTKDKKDWTAAEWSKVMFSDESKFSFSFGNQGPRVWRKRGEAQNPCCLRSSVKFPQSVMVWGAMSSAGVGPLCFLRSKVNTAVYQEVLEHFMLPAVDQLYGDADFIFQQDLAPAHNAKATSTWFKDHGIPVLNWPANSPDLNLYISTFLYISKCNLFMWCKSWNFKSQWYTPVFIVTWSFSLENPIENSMKKYFD